ncbi:hypothetical protein DMUE_0345 [Dictyocoela muelleri]|nr:hypothetical protein DMUE_0345 [Dictyocoela muelleri]
MLKFVKDDEIIFEVKLDEIEPLSYITFEEIVSLQTDSDIFFAMLFSGEIKTVYLVDNIASMRYGKIGDQLCIFDIKDPVNRLKSDKIWIFILSKNFTLDENYQADFLCDEKDIGKNRKYLDKITKTLNFDDDTLTPSVFFLYFVIYTFLFASLSTLYVIAIKWYIL